MTAMNNYRIIATNYGMAKDTYFMLMNIRAKKKGLYQRAYHWPRIYLLKDTTKSIDEVSVAVESGFDSKYLTIFRQNGFSNSLYLMIPTLHGW